MALPGLAKGFLQLSPEAAMFSRLVRAQEERNGPPRAGQGLSTAKPRGSHVTWAQG